MPATTEPRSEIQEEKFLRPLHHCSREIQGNTLLKTSSPFPKLGFLSQTDEVLAWVSLVGHSHGSLWYDASILFRIN